MIIKSIFRRANYCIYITLSHNTSNTSIHASNVDLLHVDIVVYTNQCIYNQQYILHTDCIYLYQIILRMLQTTYKE